MKRFYQQELEDIRTKLILIGEKAIEVAHIAVEGLLEENVEKLKHAIFHDLDEYGSLAQIHGIAEQVPQAELIELPDCGHSPHRDQPDRLLHNIIEFIQRRRFAVPPDDED